MGVSEATTAMKTTRSWSVTWRRGYDMYLKILHVNDDFKIKFSLDAAGRQDAAAASCSNSSCSHRLAASRFLVFLLFVCCCVCVSACCCTHSCWETSPRVALRWRWCRGWQSGWGSRGWTPCWQLFLLLRSQSRPAPATASEGGGLIPEAVGGCRSKHLNLLNLFFNCLQYDTVFSQIHVFFI